MLECYRRGADEIDFIGHLIEFLAYCTVRKAGLNLSTESDRKLIREYAIVGIRM